MTPTADRNPSEPVLVAWGTASQREDDPLAAIEPLELMRRAADRALQVPGNGRLGSAVQRIYTPRGRWTYRNPGSAIARHIGSPGAETVMTTVGVLQQTLIGDACRSIRDGEIDTALVIGGDCGYRLLQAARAGTELTDTDQEDDPDRVMAPKDELRHPAELRVGLRMPVGLYAMIHSALATLKGAGGEAYFRSVSEVHAGLSRIAAGNPDAWDRQAVSADDIMNADQSNRMQAYPYTRLHCSNWSVDQAGALFFCSKAKADALGIPDNNRIHPLASAESNNMVQVSRRSELHGCPGARIAGKAALDAAGLTVTDLDLLDLYSCFPAAVEIFASELGIPLDRPLTVTGGMTFAGGPYNNYILQATCRMADLLREARQSSARPQTGMISCVSGVITKQAFGLWSNRPGAPFAFADVTREVAAETPVSEVHMSHEGSATVAGSTVLHERGKAPKAIIIADTPGGHRVVCESDSPGTTEAVESGLNGACVTVREGRFFELA